MAPTSPINQDDSILYTDLFPVVEEAVAAASDKVDEPALLLLLLVLVLGLCFIEA
jgi:hypothetical protein